VACPICAELTEIPTEDQLQPPPSIEPSSASEIVFAAAEDSLATPSANAEELPASPKALLVPQTTQADEEIDPFFAIMLDSQSSEIAALQFRRERQESDDLDLTPMVDVTFLLLIFFMITASFTLEKTIPTPVPDPNEQSAAQPIQPEDDLLEKSIQIEITAENTIRLDDRELADPQLLRDELITSMQRDQKAEALVKVADAAHQKTVVFVLDTANEVGMQKIRLASGPDD
ncbi:MAG: biopolymer transporter ExbD, partial [Planctomycetaceae bacterium]|nr:biopolymer transporter ExbD [Planctomycetaceae bacterium]